MFQDSGALYCLWDAKDADTILQIPKKAAPDLPTERPYKIELDVQSEDFRWSGSWETPSGDLFAPARKS
jgi:hypothetical protein